MATANLLHVEVLFFFIIFFYIALPSDFDVSLAFFVHQVAVAPTMTLAALLSPHR